MSQFTCPQCRSDEHVSIVHVDPSHFGTCDVCKVGWHIGAGVLTISEEDKACAEENLKYLEDNFEHV